MAKKLTEFKNPLTQTSGSVLDIGVWLGGILWVMMFGIIVAAGTKALGTIDNKLPGTQTPNIKPYAQQAPAGNGVTIL